MAREKLGVGDLFERFQARGRDVQICPVRALRKVARELRQREHEKTAMGRPCPCPDCAASASVAALVELFAEAKERGVKPHEHET